LVELAPGATGIGRSPTTTTTTALLKVGFRPARQQIGQHDISLSNLSLETLGVLHRQWMRANLLSERAGEAMAEASADDLSEDQLLLRITVEPFGIYLYLWYGLLFSVLEGCKEKGVDLSGLESLDDSLYDGLRELRNTVFHTARRDRYVEARMFNLMAQPESARRLRDIHYRIYDDYLVPEIKRRGLWTGDEGRRFSSS
jgi:hypothetical protein